MAIVNNISVFVVGSDQQQQQQHDLHHQQQGGVLDGSRLPGSTWATSAPAIRGLIRSGLIFIIITMALTLPSWKIGSPSVVYVYRSQWMDAQDVYSLKNPLFAPLPVQMVLDLYATGWHRCCIYMQFISINSTSLAISNPTCFPDAIRTQPYQFKPCDGKKNIGRPWTINWSAQRKYQCQSSILNENCQIEY